MSAALAAIFALSLSVPAVPAAPQQEPPPSASRAMSEAERVARAYVTAYSAMDTDGMAPWVSEDVVFIDHTDPAHAEPLQGREAVLSMLRMYRDTRGLAELALDFPVVFESNGAVVFSGRVNSLSRAPGADHGFRWSAAQVTVLTVRDGKVVRHDDFADYGGAVVTRVNLAP